MGLSCAGAEPREERPLGDRPGDPAGLLRGGLGLSPLPPAAGARGAREGAGGGGEHSSCAAAQRPAQRAWRRIWPHAQRTAPTPDDVVQPLMPLTDVCQGPDGACETTASATAEAKQGVIVVRTQRLPRAVRAAASAANPRRAAALRSYARAQLSGQVDSPESG